MVPMEPTCIAQDLSTIPVLYSNLYDDTRSPVNFDENTNYKAEDWATMHHSSKVGTPGSNGHSGGFRSDWPNQPEN
jgi:hypothetical protein